MFKKIFILLILGGFLTGFTSSLAYSADFPKKPIKIIVTAAAGGGEDAEARGIAPYLEKHLGVSIQIERGKL